MQKSKDHLKAISPRSMASSTPHFALLPSAGMGHLNPFLRLAATLSYHNCNVTLITAEPTVSDSESSHISAFLNSNPKINHLTYHPQPLDDADVWITDPFFRHFEAIRRNIHLITPLLQSASPPFSAVVADISISASVAQVVLPELKLKLPSYILSVTSAKFLSLICYLPNLISDDGHVSFEKDALIHIPGVRPINKSSLPSPFFIPGNSFVAELIQNGALFSNFDGILMNTFTHFEMQTLESLNGGRVMQSLPPILSIGPLPVIDYKSEQVNKETQSMILQWLDNQPDRSVVYMSFGNRNALPKDQIVEISKALEQSSYRFVWIVKLSIVDKEDKESDLINLLGQGFYNDIKNRGLVIKEWVEQDKILSHSATGSFVSHCGWNSVVEAAERGVPVLAWPLGGDQKVHAEVLMDAGLGVWERSWGEKTLVEADEIVKKLEEVMEGVELRKSAELVGEEARRAVGDGGSSEAVLKQFIKDASAKFF